MRLRYKAFDRTGRAIEDVIEANDADQARELLRRKELFATDIVPDTDRTAAGAGATSSPSSSRLARRKLVRGGKRLRRLSMFARQLHVLITSGTPLVQGLIAIERQTQSAHWRQIVGQVRARVETGMSLAEAMVASPQYFDNVSRSMISAGEFAGALGEMLERLATLTRRQLQLRTTIVGAMVYPVLLMVIGTAVMSLMLLFVLPRFGALFKTLEAPLPPTTKALLYASAFLREWWWAVLLGASSVLGVVWFWCRSVAGRNRIQGMALNLPRFGRLMRSLLTARVARLLGTLLECRVPLLDALKLTRQSTGNVHYASLVARAEDAVTRGEAVSTVLSGSDLISPPVQEALRNGELSGRLGAPLIQMADFLDEENEVIVRTLTGLLEPAILILLGALVGLIALSMFLPLFDLVAATGGGGG
jgi:type II secretory pathway component PulF